MQTLHFIIMIGPSYAYSSMDKHESLFFAASERHTDWHVRFVKINDVCLFIRLKDLHHRCTKEMDAYVGCMYYYTNEFDSCRKEQQEFEKACPLE